MGEQWGAVGAGMLGEMVQLVLVWVLAARPELGIYGYLWAQIIAAALVVCCNMLRLCSLSMLSKALPRLLAIPLVCGAAVFLWVRVLYTFFLGCVGSQWLGVVCTAFSARRIMPVPSVAAWRACAGLYHTCGGKIRFSMGILLTNGLQNDMILPK